MQAARNEISQAPATAPFGPGNGIEECWMDFDGARMRYLRAGSGPPLLLLHGLFGYSFSWRFTMPALAPYFTLYAPDMLGAGFSDRPAGIDHSVPGTAARLVRFAENLGFASFDLLGTSRGGPVAMTIAARCLPDSGTPQVRRLVLVCPVNPYSAHGTWLAPFFGTDVGAMLFRQVIAKSPSLFRYLHARLYGDHSKIPADSLAGYQAPLALPRFVEHGLSIVQTWSADLRELQSVLPQISAIPTLLIWGDKDPAVYVSSMKPLARHFSNVETVVFPGVGHLPYEECPDDFNRALIKFLIA